MAIDKYKSDYKTVITIDENGQEKQVVEYCGDYFELNLDEAGIVNFRRSCFLLLSSILILHISAGFVDNLGMYKFYIALPYVFAFFPLLYMAAGILRLPKQKRKYRRDEFELSFERMKTTSYILMIFLATGVLSEIIFILFGSVGDQPVLEYLYFLFEALATTAVYYLISLQRKILVQPFTER